MGDPVDRLSPKLVSEELTMTHRFMRLIAALAVATALFALPMLTTPAAAGPDGTYFEYGPTAAYEDALTPAHTYEVIRQRAVIDRTADGYRFTSGWRDNHLTITYVDGLLEFHDSATDQWKRLPSSCTARSVSKGVAATCEVPADPGLMLLEIHPRLGNDAIDGRTLPATFEMAVLADQGNDVVHTGAGKDFVNTAIGVDRVHSGDGRDWIRAGISNDLVWSGPDADYVVGNNGDDTLYGEDGDDRLFGSAGTDILHGGSGSDTANGAGGYDTAYVNEDSRAHHTCESIRLA